MCTIRTTLHLVTRVKPTNGCHREARDPWRLRQQSQRLAVIHEVVGAMLCCQRCRGGRQAASDLPERLWRSHLQPDSEPRGPGQVVGPLIFGYRQTREVHHAPKPFVIVQWYHFNTRVHQQDESIVVFKAELRRLTEYCEIGTTMDDMLRDRLVCGVNDSRIQRQLLAEQDLSPSRRQWT